MKDKINAIITALDATNEDIAGYAGFDRSNVSRLRNGSRNTGPGSRTVRKLADGIYRYALEEGKLGILSEVTGLSIQPDGSASSIHPGGAAASIRPDDSSASIQPESRAASIQTDESTYIVRPDESGPSIKPDGTAVRDGLVEWLVSGDAEIKASGSVDKTRKRKASARLFGGRLSLAMKWAGLSNVRLSRLMNVDASLISRFRSGIRMPREYSDISSRMTEVLWDRLSQNGCIPDLAGYVGLNPRDVDERVFAEWLLNLKAGEDMEIRAAQNLLEIFEGFSPGIEGGAPGIDDPSPGMGAVLPSYEDLMAGEETETDRELYIGIKGIRSAVIRFLSSVIQTGAEEMCLYSDQNMEWMVGDRNFLMKWAVLMNECVRRGIRIRIIHNIDRSLGEMTEAIRNWLPLYMSGMIDPYYRDKRGNESFTHTLFLCPGLCCIGSMAVLGTDSGALYHFYSDGAHLGYYERAFNALLAGTKPLLSVTGSDTRFISSTDVTIIQETLSLATMPEKLVNSIGSSRLKEEWAKQKDILLSTLEKHKVYECVPVADNGEAVLDRLLVEPISGAGDLYYEPEQYKQHLVNIRLLGEEHPNYHFCPLPVAPFKNIKISVTDGLVRITHLERRDISFDFTHPLMCRAFRHYAERLRFQ